MHETILFIIIHTWGIERLAIVRPETTSDLKRARVYSGPHWKTGKRNWRPKSNFLSVVWFLNLWNGSSGKNTSDSLCLSFWNVVCSGGKQTLWISISGRDGSGIASAGIVNTVSRHSKFSTRLELIPMEGISKNLRDRERL